MPVFRPGRDAVDRVVVRDEAVGQREHAIAHVERLRRRELRPLAEAKRAEKAAKQAEREAARLAAEEKGEKVVRARGRVSGV